MTGDDRLDAVGGELEHQLDDQRVEDRIGRLEDQVRELEELLERSRRESRATEAELSVKNEYLAALEQALDERRRMWSRMHSMLSRQIGARVARFGRAAR
ncbi:MAG: hypothetical protein ACYCVN_05520 [Acidimicrobiales bacterium]